MDEEQQQQQRPRYTRLSLKKRHSAYSLSHNLPAARPPPSSPLPPPPSSPPPPPPISAMDHSPAKNRRPPTADSSRSLQNREEVTPWEFQEPPIVSPSVATGPMEDVTPWDMYPAPQEDVHDKRALVVETSKPKSILSKAKGFVKGTDVAPERGAKTRSRGSSISSHQRSLNNVNITTPTPYATSFPSPPTTHVQIHRVGSAVALPLAASNSFSSSDASSPTTTSTTTTSTSPSLSPTSAHFIGPSHRTHAPSVYHSPSVSTLASAISLPQPRSPNPSTYTPQTPQTAHSVSTYVSMASSTAPSMTSVASSTGKESTATGPVEEVTPWDMYPAPPAPHLPASERQRAGTIGSAISGKSAMSSSSLTGDKDREKQRQKLSSPSKRSLRQGQNHSITHTLTGPKEEVTPWEVDHVLASASAEPVTVIVEPMPLPPLHEQSPSSAGPPVMSASSGSSMSLPISTKSGSHQTGRTRGSLTLEQLEEVMPWELYPPEEGADADGEGEGEADLGSERVRVIGKTGNAGSGSAFADFGLRRRRSTGGGGGTTSGQTQIGVSSRSEKEKEKEKEKEREKEKDTQDGKERRDESRLLTSNVPGTQNQGISSASIFANGSVIPVSSSSATPSNEMGISSSRTSDPPPPPPSLPSSPPPLPSASSSGTFVSSTGSTVVYENQSGHSGQQRQSQGPKFSTADRTILEELKANLRARNQQFVLKGIGHTVRGGGRSPGKKHHTYSKSEVPYPRSYDREVLDLDVWETMFTLDICESLTWHVFESPPTKILEIGCGTGTWILQCATAWKECHFVGLDIVPLHPNLQNLGSSDLASRITWVQHNFLDGLPFQNEEFDFVHIKRIALGVPEDKWDKLFEEIARVMKPGGAFEMIEEDLFFPGKRVDEEDAESVLSFRGDLESANSRRNSSSSDQARFSGPNGHHEETSKLPQVAEGSSPATPTGLSSNNEQLPSHPTSPIAEEPTSTIENEDTAGDPATEAPPLRPPSAATFTPPVAKSLTSRVRPTLSVQTTPPNAGSFGEMSSSPGMFGSNMNVLGGIGYLASQDPLMEALKQHKRERAAAKSTYSSSMAVQRPRTFSASATTKNKPTPYLLKSLISSDKEPANPRDHSILQTIWEGMLGSRFVNSAPLSLLMPYLEYHFKDVRTHPPLMYTFPPVPPRRRADEYDDEPKSKPKPGKWFAAFTESEQETDDARDFAAAFSGHERPTKSHKSIGLAGASAAMDEHEPVTEENRFLSMKALMKRTSPYVSLDDSRGYAYAPSSLPLKFIKDGKVITRRISRLPNSTLRVDLRTLNLHLSMRAKEIVACSEEMWDWVLEVQEAEKKRKESRERRSRYASIEGYGGLSDTASISSSTDTAQSTIMELTRDDFDLLLNNFEMDMQDKSGLGHGLAQRFGWVFIYPQVLQDRKAFDKACDKYDDWLDEQRAIALLNGYHRIPSEQQPPKNSISTSGLVLPMSESPAPYDFNVISRSSSAPQPTNTDHAVVENNNSSGLFMSSDPNHAPPFSPASQISMQRPSQMLSRAMRVFVAWKDASS